MTPEDWSKIRLGEIIESLEAGVSVNGDDRPALPHEAGVLKISAVTSGTFDPSQNKAIRADELNRAATTPAADRIIISRSNTESLVGASAYIQNEHLNLYLSDKLWQINPGKANPPNMRWLSYWLASTATRQKLSQLATGTSGSMKNITKSQLLALDVNVPLLAEQHRIAQALATWDQAIATTERLLANSKLQRRALLAKTLRLHAGATEVALRKRLGNSPPSIQTGIPSLPPTPMGWDCTGLGKHLQEIRRPIALEPDRSYTLVTVKRSRGGVQAREILRGSEVKTPSQFIVRTGDFLISKRQIVHGACGIVPRELDGAVVSNEYAVLNSDGLVDLPFLRYLSESVYFQQTCYHSSIGVHVEKMIFKTERWLRWPFNLPPLLEQQRIVKFLDAASQEVATIERHMEALRQEKRALMSTLLTGQRRFPAKAAP